MEKMKFFLYKYRTALLTLAILLVVGSLIVFGGWLLGWDLAKVFLSPFALLCYTLAVAVSIFVFATIYRKKRGL